MAATFTAIAAINGCKVIHSLRTTATDEVGTINTQDTQYLVPCHELSTAVLDGWRWLQSVGRQYGT